MIKCLVCGKPQKLITPAHLRTHGLTAEQYKAKYPHAKMSSRAFRQRRAEVMTERWQDPDNLEHLRESCRRVQLAAWEGDDERREAQAQRAREVLNPLWDDPAWRAQRSADQREKAIKLWKQPEYRKKMVASARRLGKERARKNTERARSKYPPMDVRTDGWFYAIRLFPEAPRMKFGYSRAPKVRFKSFSTLCPDMQVIGCWPAKLGDESVAFELLKSIGAKLIEGEIYLVKNIGVVVKALDDHFRRNPA